MREAYGWEQGTGNSEQLSRKKVMSSSSNLERFLLCATPDVPSLTLPQGCSDLNGQWLFPCKETVEYFTLKDLWDCYYEWSAYGVGTPLMLESGDTLMQYHVPYLSAIQIYTSKSVTASRIRREDSEGVEFESDSWSEDSESDKLSRSMSNNSSKAWDVASLDSSSDQAGSWTTTKDMIGDLYLQYNETSPYWQRVPFTEKITELARSHPALMTLRSVDISPTSWMAVAWYPIYSVPCQSNKDLTSFLTFHTLSSFQDCGSKYDGIDREENTSCLSEWRSIIGEKCKKKESGCISLSPFGLATYKVRENIWSNDSNKEVVGDMYNAADSWLKNLNADHHDFNFFARQTTLSFPFGDITKRKVIHEIKAAFSEWSSEMGPLLGLILVGFGLGVLAVVAVETLGLLWIMKRLRHKITKDEAYFSSKTLAPPMLDPQQSLDFAFRKQGVVWVLESGKISKPREQKRKTELLEVSPVKMYGEIKGKSLILREADGLHSTIELKGCSVQAVSASILSSRKWAKKFPIKVENTTSVLYNGSKTIFIYLDTSWEKEAWCKALYLASCDQKKKIEWFTQLDEEFHSYLTSLNAVYHSFMKPPVESSVEVIEKATRTDGSSSKVRQFLKKVAKRTSRVGLENKSTWTSLSGHEEKKNTEKLRACQDAILATGLLKAVSTSKHPKNSMVDNDKFGIDEGTLCWNLLISRLFFDAKGNEDLRRSMQARIQKTLSNMRTPSYIGEVICTNINTGNVPPCIVGMRVLPMEMSEVWAVEVDIEYSGGALLEIETRIEGHELELHAGTEDSNPPTNSAAAVPSDLLEGFEYFGEQLNFAERTDDLQEQKQDGDWNSDVSKSFKRTMSSVNHGSRWKSILNSVAKQVSQVPLSLAIRIASLRGTLRLHIKPPPSDQLWYGFTSMPDIDFNLESSVGERKITSAHFALFLVNRLKTGIRETFVLPNCESVCIPWMLAEKNDWVPRNVAPFIWINQEYGNESSTSIDTNNQPSGGVKARLEAGASTSSNDPEHKQQNPESAEFSHETTRKSSDSLEVPLSFSSSVTLESSRSLEELNTPLLLENDKSQKARDLKEFSSSTLQNDRLLESNEQNIENDSESLSQNTVVVAKRNHSITQEDGLPKKMGRRERMLDLGKKMSEKLEEKRRHIEEKSRHIVEKMRGP
ncbi:hypothetical protein VNO78_20249 [Psophocarpus tetragonolobus]|uniref:SMP-LTD domain-containing protein n=1 Tax=Psophocarpus tetragonolobus TaxID=3891 RepID=A0AAN9S9K6_PSOTE